MIPAFHHEFAIEVVPTVAGLDSYPMRIMATVKLNRVRSRWRHLCVPKGKPDLPESVRRSGEFSDDASAWMILADDCPSDSPFDFAERFVARANRHLRKTRGGRWTVRLAQ